MRESVIGANEIITSQARLDGLVQSWVGKVCWQFTRLYGGEYHFHFGEKRGSGKDFFGEWYLSTYGTDFVVSEHDKVLIDTATLDDEADNREQIEAVLLQLVGKRLSHVQTDYALYSIRLEFEQGLCLEILPTAEDDEYDLLYWYISFPDDKCLSINRNHKFFYSDRLYDEAEDMD